MNKKNKAALLFLILNIMSGLSQNRPSISYDIKPISPTASQISRYDELPVSEYTGIPNISIPLYTIEVDEVKLPIDLTYHAGGIKVNQDASWVGLGWNLSLGSLIQIINRDDDLFSSARKCLPDYCKSGGYTAGYADFPYPCSIMHSAGCTNNMKTEIEKPENRFSYRIAVAGYMPFDGQLRQLSNLIDPSMPALSKSEPDIFKIHIFGETINFIIDYKSPEIKFIVLNKKGYKIEIDKQTQTWCITMPEGTKLYFKDHVRPNSWVITNSGAYKSKSPTTWMLNKIETVKGNTIEIEYAKSKGKIKTSSRSDTYGKRLNRWYYEATGRVVNASLEDAYEGVSKSILESEEEQYYIESINFPNGNLKFSLSGRIDLSWSQKLDKIELFNNTGKRIKKIDLNYGFFALHGNHPIRRLKLVNLIINNTEIYSFQYNKTVLPPIGSLSQDYWGYYNGHDNKSLIPNPKRFNKNIIISNLKEFRIDDPLIINNNGSFLRNSW